MTINDKTLKASKESTVDIDCEGIRTTGQYCEEGISLKFPRMGENGRAMSAAQRKSRARAIAAKKGWRAPKGFDECPKVHGFMPTIKVEEVQK